MSFVKLRILNPNIVIARLGYSHTRKPCRNTAIVAPVIPSANSKMCDLTACIGPSQVMVLATLLGKY